jgi:hypothetical protein
MKIFAHMDDGRQLELSGALGRLINDSMLFFRVGDSTNVPSQQDVEAIRDALAKVIMKSDTAPEHPVPFMFLPPGTDIFQTQLPKDVALMIHISVPEGQDMEKMVGPAWLPDNIGMMIVEQGAVMKIFDRPSQEDIDAFKKDAETKKAAEAENEVRPPDSM